MHFKVTARTILQLGAELISSDAIAFYELIKNAFDAASKRVEVRIVIRINQNKVEEVASELSTATLSKADLGVLVNELIETIDLEAPRATELRGELLSVQSQEDLCDALRRSNYIIIRDTGEGMSMTDLERIYLTIGTRNRQEQRTGIADRKNARPILGEKGIGRLSVMRLGDGLTIETTKSGETHYNILEIDWSIFSHQSNDLLDSIELEPKIGSEKNNPESAGTTIWIYDLKSRWSKDKLEQIGRDELSRFVDPFQRLNRDFIVLWFNKEPVVLTGIDKTLIENAQASLTAEFVVNQRGEPRLEGAIDYRLYNRQKTFNLDGTHLLSVSDADIKVLQLLGPFKLELYYYNRKRITVEYGIDDVQLVKKLVDRWGGGVMVYRDGFRVNPYGGPDDDWLKLDKKALASQGYKLNRRQFVGKLEISSRLNPNLLDQTNREGLRDNAEKAALISLLQYIIWVPFKTFLEDVDQSELEKKAEQSLEAIEKRLVVSEKKAKDALAYLISEYPQIGSEEEVIDSINTLIEDSKNLIRNAKVSAESLERRLNTTIHLAGLGLMVDVIAHELNRATHHAIQTLNSLSTSELSQKSIGSVTTLRSQLKTLQTRLKVLDPLGPSGRQRKELTLMGRLIRDTLSYHKAQFDRHDIKLVIQEDASSKNWEMNVVPGMIVQIIENLVSNSVYWLKQEMHFHKLKHPNVTVTIDEKNKVIMVTDNGPGIPAEKSEEVFQPFFTTKPPAEGKGLGLYISREIAGYHGARLYLRTDDSPVLRTFVLDLKKHK